MQLKTLPGNLTIGDAAGRSCCHEPGGSVNVCVMVTPCQLRRVLPIHTSPISSCSHVTTHERGLVCVCVLYVNHVCDTGTS